MSELEPYAGRVARLTAIICQGLISDTQRCGRTFTGTGTAPLVDRARAAGWRIGQRRDGTPDAMCPTCARPDPATVALCRDLEQSVQR